MSGNNILPSLGEIKPGELAPESWAQASHARGVLRLEQADIIETVETRQIMGYEDCVKGYQELVGQMGSVTDHLFAAMGIARPSQDASGEFTSWQHRVVTSPDNNTELDVMQAVMANVVRGVLGAGKYFPVVSVSSYVVHKPERGDAAMVKGGVTRLGGRMTGKVVFMSDGHHMKIDAEHGSLRPFKDLVASATTAVTDVARREALEPLAKEFAELDKVPEGISFDSAFGLNTEHDPDRSVWAVLTRNPETPERALNILDRAFRQTNITAIYKLLDVHIDQLSHNLEAQKMTSRFEWLANRLTATRQAISEGIRQGLIFGFKEAFLAELLLEQQKVKALAAVAIDLGLNTVSANDCAPAEG